MSNQILVVLVSVVLAYVTGGLPFGYWFVRLTAGQDIRTMGSGNIGATNVYRTRGGRAGVIVLALDMMKGFFAVFAAAQISHSDSMAVAGALFAVVLGHCYPLFLNFQGGKAVACYVGAFLFLAPMVLLAVFVVFFAIVSLTKYVSLASIICAALFPVVLLVIHPSAALLWACAAASVLVIYRHRGNIERLRTGRENAFSLKGGKAA